MSRPELQPGLSIFATEFRRRLQPCGIVYSTGLDDQNIWQGGGVGENWRAAIRAEPSVDDLSAAALVREVFRVPLIERTCLGTAVPNALPACVWQPATVADSHKQ
jgi:hypothetical protein